MVGVRLNASPLTVTEAEALLFVLAGSLADPLTCALKVELPAVVCSTVTVTVALAPLAKLPRLQVSGPALEQVPCDDVIDTIEPKLTPLDVSTTSVALDGPALPTVAVNTLLLPVAVVLGAERVSARSAFVELKSATAFACTLQIPQGM